MHILSIFNIVFLKSVRVTGEDTIYTHNSNHHIDDNLIWTTVEIIPEVTLLPLSAAVLAVKYTFKMIMCWTVSY